MNDTPGITAVLPCFNHARFLEERIKSVLSQTHRVNQIVFLDDASTDGSIELAKELLGEFTGQVDYCLNSVNSGSPFAQWNKGVALAKHELVWIAETDDSCDPQLIEALFASILSTRSLLSYAQSRYIDDEGEDLGPALSYTDRLWPSAFRHSFSMDGAQFNWRYMAGLNVIPNASAVLFRKDVYLSAGSANETMRFCGDWDLWIRMCSKGTVAFISDELNYFRCHAATSRAAGYTPKIAAEYFACRVSACIGGKGIASSSLSAIDLIKGLLNPGEQWQWNQVVRSLSSSSLPEGKSRYEELSCLPMLGGGTWRMLRILYLFKVAKAGLAALPRLFSRIAAKGISLLFSNTRKS